MTIIQKWGNLESLIKWLKLAVITFVFSFITITVGIILVQMILELELEPSPRRPVTLPLVEHLANMGGERHEPDKVFAEQPFALFRLALNEEAAGGGQFDGTVLELGELEDTQGRSNRKEIVDIERK